MSRTAIVEIIAEPYDAIGQRPRDLALTGQHLKAAIVGAQSRRPPENGRRAVVWRRVRELYLDASCAAEQRDHVRAGGARAMAGAFQAGADRGRAHQCFRDQRTVTDTRTVVVFGGTGFLGRRVVRHLLDHRFSVRAASRHPAPSAAVKSATVVFVRADVNDDESIVDAVKGAFAVVNAVSLYTEHGRQTFDSIHVQAAARVARHSRQSGVQRLLHVSGIGANAASTSRYIASRGRGEAAVRGEFPAAIIIRPAVMFGVDDSFVTPLVGLMRTFPVFPLFGAGRTLLQPSWVEDVAEGLARALEVAGPAEIYELAGPQIYSYQTLVRTISERFGLSRALVPVPFGLWHALAVIAARLPYPPLARTQVELMELDNVASPDCPGFPALGINPRPLGEFLKRQ